MELIPTMDSNCCGDVCKSEGPPPMRSLLDEKKKRLEADLATINQAIKVVEENPSFSDYLDLLRRANRL